MLRKIVTGQDSTVGAAVSGFETVSSTGTFDFATTITGLTNGNYYKFAVVWYSSTGSVYGNVVESDQY